MPWDIPWAVPIIGAICVAAGFLTACLFGEAVASSMQIRIVDVQTTRRKSWILLLVGLVLTFFGIVLLW